MVLRGRRFDLTVRFAGAGEEGPIAQRWESEGSEATRGHPARRTGSDPRGACRLARLRGGARELMAGRLDRRLRGLAGDVPRPVNGLAPGLPCLIEEALA